MHVAPLRLLEGTLGARLTNVLAELPHERDAELADLVVRLALGVEVTAALATSHVDCESLLVVVTFERTLNSSDDLRPVSAFLKICSKPKNLRMDRLTVGWKRRPPL